ncbi:sulfite exporter TauE/SafE family protein [Massilia sp. W12]|uniref:sulfite exporter TauE/SafE family protein n=1 Tax=Massilia sp. W12 TaxID=3126507 RepID=UPI0030CF4D17
MMLLVLGALVGVVLGLTGAGGGMLGAPALMWAMQWNLAQAGPVALLAVVAAASLGALDGLRKRLLRWRAALLMATAGIPASALGGWLALRSPQALLQVLFALAMLAAALRQLRAGAGRSEENEADLGRIARVCEKTGRFQWNAPTFALIAAIGAVSGLLTGLLGVGGGFVMVPLLRRFSNVRMHGIVATSLSVIALVGLFSVAMHWPHLNPDQSRAAWAFVIAAMAGMLLGRHLAARLPAARVQLAFACLLIVVAGQMLWRALAHIAA